MKKIGLLLISLISSACLAETNSMNIDSIVINSIQQQPIHQAQNPLGMLIYGGHDFSKSEVAIANMHSTVTETHFIG